MVSRKGGNKPPVANKIQSKQRNQGGNNQANQRPGHQNMQNAQ